MRRDLNKPVEAHAGYTQRGGAYSTETKSQSLVVLKVERQAWVSSQVAALAAYIWWKSLLGL